MALFKVFHGDEKDLNTQVPIVEGRNYFLTDNGKMFVDTASERICLNAEEADMATGLKNGDDVVTANQLVKTSDTIGIGNGGTGAKTLVEARAGLQIDRAVANIVTLTVEGWTDAGDGKYKQIVNLPSLSCGSAGNVPPVISPAANTSTINFGLLDSVDADVTNKTLTVISRGLPTEIVNIVVTDHQ